MTIAFCAELRVICVKMFGFGVFCFLIACISEFLCNFAAGLSF